MTTNIHSTEAARVRTKAHDAATQIGFQDLCSDLNRVLGRQLLSVIVRKDPRTTSRWVAGTSSPSREDERRLRNAYQVYGVLAAVEGDHTIRAWFMGMNPQLEDESPAEALAADHSRDVMAAARAFVNGG